MAGARQPVGNMLVGMLLLSAVISTSSVLRPVNTDTTRGIAASQNTEFAQVLRSGPRGKAVSKEEIKNETEDGSHVGNKETTTKQAKNETKGSEDEDVSSDLDSSHDRSAHQRAPNDVIQAWHTRHRRNALSLTPFSLVAVAGLFLLQAVAIIGFLFKKCRWWRPYNQSALTHDEESGRQLLYSQQDDNGKKTQIKNSKEGNMTNKRSKAVRQGTYGSVQYQQDGVAAEFGTVSAIAIQPVNQDRPVYYDPIVEESKQHLHSDMTSTRHSASSPSSSSGGYSMTDSRFSTGKQDADVSQREHVARTPGIVRPGPDARAAVGDQHVARDTRHTQETVASAGHLASPSSDRLEDATSDYRSGHLHAHSRARLVNQQRDGTHTDVGSSSSSLHDAAGGAACGSSAHQTLVLSSAGATPVDAANTSRRADNVDVVIECIGTPRRDEYLDLSPSQGILNLASDISLQQSQEESSSLGMSSSTSIPSIVVSSPLSSDSEHEHASTSKMTLDKRFLVPPPRRSRKRKRRRKRRRRKKNADKTEEDNSDERERGPKGTKRKKDRKRKKKRE